MTYQISMYESCHFGLDNHSRLNQVNLSHSLTSYSSMSYLIELRLKLLTIHDQKQGDKKRYKKMQ